MDIVSVKQATSHTRKLGRAHPPKKKGKLKRETESLLIAAQNNGIKTSYIKAKIDKTWQNSKCRLYGDRDETINHIISECSKLAQKRLDMTDGCGNKVIHWELFKKLKSDYANKWYIYKTASVMEKETRTPLRFLDTVGSSYLSQTTRPYNNQQQKRKLAELYSLHSRLTTD